MREKIEVGYQAFVFDWSEGFGAVREVFPSASSLNWPKRRTPRPPSSRRNCLRASARHRYSSASCFLRKWRRSWSLFVHPKPPRSAEPQFEPTVV